MKDRRKLFSHAFLAAAPLLMLAALTMAWFVNSRSSQVASMTFAATDAGPGATLYRAAEVKDRAYDAEAVPATLTNTAVWGNAVPPEESDITIRNMVPGQCEYYLLVADGDTDVTLKSVKLLDADGNEAAPGGGVPLAQCVGLYLTPVAVDRTAEIEGTSHTIGLSLGRAGDGRLLNAFFAGDPAALADPLPTTDGEASAAYVLSVFYDPVYLQTRADPQPVNTLGGSISFSLSFAAAPESGAG